ncbi:polysaccharide pyruvyl transferase family protein [Paenirhodobacter populi]|nr:polysaccharide pyruvyl transferase family protein [Sinirhodobacter populi]
MSDILTGPHGHDYAKLATLLRSFGDEKVVFVANPGNAGDALINLGMYAFFDHIGLQWESGQLGATYPDRIVIYSGGGALLDIYPNGDAFFLRNHPVCKALVLLPHTVRGYAGMLADMDERCHLFAREAETLTYLREHAQRAHVHYGHDMAFFLSDQTIAEMNWDRQFLLRPEIRVSWPKMMLKILATLKLRDPVLHILRGDAEATGASIPAYNYDLSELFSSGHLLNDPGGYMTPGICASTIKALRLLLRSARQVETNRLHMTVLSAIVGTPVTMMDNSYGKNRGIYERSIRDYFPAVTFEPAPLRA